MAYMKRLTDKFGRPLQDLRISVIDRCNFRCTYCMPREIFGKDFPFLPKDNLLTFDEIVRLASIFTSLGVRKIRLTGGEPLLRRGLPELIGKLTSLSGLQDIGLTTNGLLLGSQATDLKQAGLDRVNVSLDALDDSLLRSINDTGVGPARIIASIEKARLAGLEVKVNMVVIKGKNEQEILPMAAYFREAGVALRFIEFMDVGQTNGWNFDKVVPKQQIHDLLDTHFGLEPLEPAYNGEVAKRYRYRNSQSEVGFITSVSESFCSGCTRARIAADGKMYNCLFATGGVDFRTSLRNGATEEELKQLIAQTWAYRSDRYSDERTAETVRSRKKIEMSYIGG
ncbi:GTP 3',8-cyclase MoaA [Terribacillus sp. 179-K 1B1 HS]|uniref:GTP 3',8-cyclase MoaA n=1 Tax=Terribacillus sp. 179-K 1B1 HS TaxID=3142388 RepID=UPI0039A10DFB